MLLRWVVYGLVYWLFLCYCISELSGCVLVKFLVFMCVWVVELVVIGKFV